MNLRVNESNEADYYTIQYNKSHYISYVPVRTSCTELCFFLEGDDIDES